MNTKDILKALVKVANNQQKQIESLAQQVSQLNGELMSKKIENALMGANLPVVEVAVKDLHEMMPTVFYKYKMQGAADKTTKPAIETKIKEVAPGVVGKPVKTQGIGEF